MNKKKIKNKSPLKAGIWYIICNFLVKGLTFITMPIFTRLMTSSDIGNFSNITSWFNILAIVTTLEVYSSVSIARFDYKNDLNEYIASSLSLGTIITLFFYIIVLVFNKFFMTLFCMDFKTINIIFIYLLFYPSIHMFMIKNQINYNYRNTVLLSIINALCSSIGSILLVILLSNKLYGRIIGYFVPQIFIAIVIYTYIIIKGKKISTKYWKYAIKISFPLMWHLLAGYILSSSDRIMITKLIGTEANALYSVSYTLSTVVSILWTSMNNAWSPWAYEQMNKKEYNKLNIKSKPYLILFLIIVYMFMLATPELLLIMGGSYYMQAKYVMPPVMIGYVFQFIYSLYVNIEFYHKKQKNIAIGTALAAILNIILNLVLIPKFGYIAAAYTTLVGYISLLVIHYLFVKRLGCTEWYDTKFFGIISIIALLSIFIFNLLYKMNAIRYIIITISAIGIFIIIFKNINAIIEAIKSKSLKNVINIFYRKGEI